MKFRCLLSLAALSAAPLCARAAAAQVTLPAILSNHMVVQRGLPVHLWGMAAPSQQVQVSFRGETESATANRLGQWSIYLKPGAAGGPFEMTVEGKAGPDASENTIHLVDILVGDVWLASGQSNMEFEMRKAATAPEDLPKATIPDLRLLMVDKKPATFAQTDIETPGWQASSPTTARNFSAVAWYFAREIRAREHVPVGIIDSTWGGTIVESWVRLTALGQDASLAPLFVSRGEMTDHEATGRLEEKDEQKQIAAARAAGKPIPQFPWHPPLDTWAPGLLWNGMIAPLTPFPIRGVLWYQGESNSAVARAPLYSRIFRDLIEDWRREWGIGNFPFLYVQISNFKSTPLEDWAVLREEQFKTLEVANTAMTVTIDIGNPDDVHPTDKVDVGHRLALAARALSYSEQVVYSGPLFLEAAPEDGSIRAWFDNADGLMAKGGTVTGFEVAGADRKFVPASARIQGTTVVASSPQVPQPLFVRYGWANSPQCNLFNASGLPASPFTSLPY
ncbi:MAG: sialate O-acetylesterase [Terracidiphilus sp.]